MSTLVQDARKAFRIFDEAAYLHANPDVAAASSRGDVTSAQAHYLERGQFDGRSGVPLLEEIFDEAGYLTNYPDVAAAVASGRYSSGAAHFIAHGHAEGRRPRFDDDMIPASLEAVSAVLEQKRGMVAHFDRRNPFPSEDMLAPSEDMDAQSAELPRRYRCRWIEDSITIHSDGNVSCGLDDPHAMRSFGNVHRQSVEDIFANAEFAELASKLRRGHRCRNCSLYEVDPRNDEEFARSMRARAVRTLVVEPTILCNLRCHNLACIPNNDPLTRARAATRLDLESFQRVIDQLGADLGRVYFFNYGDPFLHPQAEDMLLYLRHSHPQVEIITSTNGIPLAKPSRTEAVVEARVDHIIFTISGMTQDSYARYHLNGKLSAALDGLRNLCDAKTRAGRLQPQITWRYLLFRWNDSDAEIERAIRLAQELGVTLRLYLTHLPIEAASYRFSPGSPAHRRFARFIDCAHGYNCEAPGEDGLFHLESFPRLGEARWTSSKARMHVRAAGSSIRLFVSTLRPLAATRPTFVKISTKWTSVRKPLIFEKWNAHQLLIPPAYRSGAFDIELEAEQCWYPAEEIGSQDLRCLGFLVKPFEADDAARAERSLAEAIEDRGHGGRFAERSLAPLDA